MISALRGSSPSGKDLKMTAVRSRSSTKLFVMASTLGGFQGRLLTDVVRFEQSRVLLTVFSEGPLDPMGKSE
jgi:hypothetical protein